LGHRIFELAPDQALDGEVGVFRVGDRLALGGLSDQPLTVLGESDDRRVVRAPSAFSSTLG